MDYYSGSAPQEFSSNTFMWSTKDKLGHGATGQVFVGYNKRTGDKVAVKVFTKVSEYRAMQNEMKTIKELKFHKNLVQFLEIDELEKNTRAHTIVMELCNGGSLYEVIDSPVNAMGLDEFQFKIVMSDVAEGLAHLRQQGFVHRDIKPGNIMRCIMPDGSYIFKLADFGTARKLGPDERFTSLHGTEEYLYPAMYERALIDPRSKQDFVDKVDLWSVGATFFHLATGRLPFQPYKKREDRATMYKIITQKESGVILGWQTQQGGKIFYSKELPPDVAISVGLRNVITPILGGLLDTFANMWNFKHFFSEIKRVTGMKVVDVFCVSRCTSHKIYLDQNHPNVLPVLREKICQQTSLDPKHMEFYFENIPFAPKEPIKTEQLPATTPDSPLTVFGGPPQKADSLETPILARPPQMHPDIAVIDDLRYSKDCTKTVYACYHSAVTVERCFRLMHQVALTLRETLSKEYETWCRNLEEVKLQYKSFVELSDVQISNLKSHITLLKVMSSSYNHALSDDIQFLSNKVKENEKFLQQIKDEQYSIHQQTNDFHPQISRILGPENWDCNYCCDIFDGSTRTMKAYVDIIEELFKSFQEQKKSRGVPQSTYDKRVHEHNKKTIKKTIELAEGKLRTMIEGRSRVYAKLYEFLRTYIPVREELNGFTESLKYCSENLKHQSIPKHHQKMNEIVSKLASMTDKRSGPPSNPSAPHSEHSSFISSITEHIQRLQMCTKQTNELVTKQAESLKKM